MRQQFGHGPKSWGQILFFDLLGAIMVHGQTLRIEFEVAVYHITSRGTAGAAIFFGDEDRLRLLDLPRLLPDVQPLSSAG